MFEIQDLRVCHFTGFGVAALDAQAPQLEPQAPAVLVFCNFTLTKTGSGQRSKACFNGLLMLLGASVSRQYTVQPATSAVITKN